MNKPHRQSLFTPLQEANPSIYLTSAWQAHEKVVMQLSQLSQNVLLITAPLEGGKTSFLRHILSAPSKDLHKVSITIEAHSTVETLLKQVMLSFGLNFKNSADAYEQIFHLQQHSVTSGLGMLSLFVDDAHLLTTEQLQALLQLVNHQAEPSQQLRLILLGEPSLELRMFSPELTAITHGKIYTIELESWTIQDINTFLKQTCAEVSFSKEEVALMFEKTRGLPGLIIRDKNAVLEQKTLTGKPMTKRSFKLWGLHPISLGVLAGITLGGVYLIFNNLTSEEEATIAPINAAQSNEQKWPEQNISPKKTSPAVAFHFDKVDTSDVIEDDMKQDAEEAKPLSEHMPQMDTPKAQLQAQAPAPAATQAPAPAQDHEQPSPAQIAKQPVTAQKVETAVKVEKIAKAEKITPKAATNKSLSAQENYLLGLDKRQYTLQLLGASKESSIQQFVKKHALEGTSYSFHTKRQGKDWYAVVYGNYKSADEAKQAAKNLSQTLKSSNVQPWVREVSAVQKDIQQKQG
ncbi:MAG: SPOR domain-containing protein [Proteobacteria bacterium]|nr:SPOR domain-containing protein [Pseudomonadota bacterium]